MSYIVTDFLPIFLLSHGTNTTGNLFIDGQFILIELFPISNQKLRFNQPETFIRDRYLSRMIFEITHNITKTQTIDLTIDLR